MSKRTCIICQTELTGRQQNACSTRCASKIYTNRRRDSGKLKGAKPLKYPFICIMCDRPGKATKTGVQRHPYCARVSTQTPERKLSSSTEIVHIPKSHPKHSASATKGSFWWACKCKICGQTFNATAKYATCSDICEAAHKRNKRSSTKHRHRARKQKATVENVSRLTVYQRDKYICKLCGKPTSPNSHYLDNLFPSLDHIVALVNGGAHSYENLQTAHRICNSIKRDT